MAKCLKIQTGQLKEYIYLIWFLIQFFMEKINIGYNAGTVLQKLGETGFVAIAELARKLNLGADDTALAAGWLAREGKVRIERKNGVLYVANQA